METLEDMKFKDIHKAELKLKVTVLLSDEGIIAGNKLGYSNYEVYCLMHLGLQYFIEDEFYEMCAKVQKYLAEPEMEEIATNFVHYSKAWAKTKKLF